MLGIQGVPKDLAIFEHVVLDRIGEGMPVLHVSFNS